MAQMTAQRGSDLLQLVQELQDRRRFQELNWIGTFEDYLDIIASNPKVTRNAFKRIYDMIMMYGTEDFIDAKKRLIRYKFFSDASFDGDRSEEHTSELQSPYVISYAVFCLKKKEEGLLEGRRISQDLSKLLCQGA